jgi:hypothetical protein
MQKQKIEQKIEREFLKLQNLKRMLKGSLNKVSGKSDGKDGKCKVVNQLTYKGEKNITKTIYVSAVRLAETKRMIDNYQKAKKILNKILELNAELFKLESSKDASH